MRRWVKGIMRVEKVGRRDMRVDIYMERENGRERK